MKNNQVTLLHIFFVLAMFISCYKNYKKEENINQKQIADKKDHNGVLARDSCLYIFFDDKTSKKIYYNGKEIIATIRKHKYSYICTYPLYGGHILYLSLRKKIKIITKPFKELNAYKIYSIHELWEAMQPILKKDDSLKLEMRNNAKLRTNMGIHYEEYLPSALFFYENKGMFVLEVDSIKQQATFVPVEIAFNF